MNGFERSPAIMIIMISGCFRCEDDKARRGDIRTDNGIPGPVNLGEDNYFHPAVPGDETLLLTLSSGQV